jgi:hypothetical protein
MAAYLFEIAISTTCDFPANLASTEPAKCLTGTAKEAHRALPG